MRRHFEYDLSREKARTLKVREAFQMLEEKRSEDVMQLGLESCQKSGISKQACRFVSVK